MDSIAGRLVVPLHVEPHDSQGLRKEHDDTPFQSASIWQLDGTEGSMPVESYEQSPDETPFLDESAEFSPTILEESGDASVNSSVAVVDERNAPTSTRLTVELHAYTLLNPRSCFEPFDPGLPIVSEKVALETLSRVTTNAAMSLHSPEFTEYHLDDFAVYRDSHKTSFEMTSLNQLDTRFGHRNYFFNGVLSSGDTKLYVKRVPIIALPIGNHGSVSKHTVRGNIWISSEMSHSRNIFYKLRQPAVEYVRFYRPFLWVADLAKHFVDFLMVMGRGNRSVTIHHFRSMFANWLRKTHKGAPSFDAWVAEHPSSDFRSSIVANISFLHKEVIGVLGHHRALRHAIWAEVWDFVQYKPSAKPVTNLPHTIVTRYIFDAFSHLPFGDCLQPTHLHSEAQRLRDNIVRTWSWGNSKPSGAISSTPTSVLDLKPGNTISTPRDAATSGTSWQREVPAGFTDVDRWFGLVLKVHKDSKGRRSFDVIWYYRPVDTLCGIMKYPWHKELFLSDHCSCAETPKIKENEILSVHSVEFGGTPSTQAEFFCRQIYLSEERSWTTLKETHRSCVHINPQAALPDHTSGDTVLVHIDTKSSISEPCEVVCSFRENDKLFYRLRRLLRRQSCDPAASQSARPNELVYTNQLVEVRSKRILGTCSVRFFDPNEEVPVPYNRDGVGGFFFITHEEIHVSDGLEYLPLQTIPTTLRQGFDPTVERPKLRGLDLFCGGGNFGRGLEECGGVEMRWANDFNATALHTYMANADPAAVRPFLGSIDDMQSLSMQAKFSRNVPQIGDVDFISAGSPCPGFSRITNDKTTIAQRKNQSLVAAYASFVDLYRPKYALLENVPGIVQKRSNRDQDVFSQLICAMVGLGYQTRFFFLDASSCGSPQRRSRVFLIIAAPGLKLPGKPQQTHSHPAFTKGMGLGKLPNGESMAERDMPVATPFKFVSAEEATADLPPLYDAKPDICVPFPDHRISIGITRPLRSRMTLIPTRPFAFTFAQAWFGPDRKKAGSGVLTPSEREEFPVETKAFAMKAVSKAYGRQHPHRLLETITTKMHPGDAKCGRAIHWHEPRVLTIMEARRAQGFRDDEVILGLPAQQFKIVGNSVAREVAVALGAVIQAAWAQSQEAVTSAAQQAEEYVEASMSDEEDVKETADDASASTDSNWPVSCEPTPDTIATDVSPSPQRGASFVGVKRTSITVEIYASKCFKTETRSYARRTSTKLSDSHTRPSPLRQSIESPVIEDA